MARKRNAAIQYDYKAQAPHFDYTDDSGKARKVWFEDARSIQDNLDVVKR